MRANSRRYNRSRPRLFEVVARSGDKRVSPSIIRRYKRCTESGVHLVEFQQTSRAPYGARSRLSFRIVSVIENVAVRVVHETYGAPDGSHQRVGTCCSGEDSKVFAGHQSIRHPQSPERSEHGGPAEEDIRVAWVRIVSPFAFAPVLVPVNHSLGISPL